MARVNVWLPDELYEQVKEQLAGLKISHVLQDRLRALLQCRHLELACRECGKALDRYRLIDEAMSHFYFDLLWELDHLVRDLGTAEGACRVIKDVAERHQVSAASRMPLPRPSRANREAAREKRFAAEQPTPLPREVSSRSRHPSARSAGQPDHRRRPPALPTEEEDIA